MNDARVRPKVRRLIGQRFFVLGGIRIPSFLAMLYLGCASGLVLGAASARANGLDEQRFVFATIALMLPAFAGARLWFVLQRIETFRGNLRAIWRSGDGGAALYGGLVGGVALSPLVLSVAGLPFAQYWDAASMTMLVAVVVTRFGCLMNGCCVGHATTGPLGLWLPDVRGNWVRRFPTQLFEAGWAAIVLVAVLSMRTRFAHPGALFATVVGAYAAGRLVIEPTRESTHPERTTYVNLAFSATLLVAALAALLYKS